MIDSDWFHDWFNSPYYHLLYRHRDEQEAAAFIERLIGHLQPPPGSRMLDVACGKGRHAVQLARHGFEVTGFDLSEESIAFAQQSAGPNLQFFRHDMRQTFHIKYFHYAFNFFTSFGYFDTRREHESAIRSIADALLPGGLFVLDYLNAGTLGDMPAVETELQLEGIDYRITKWSDAAHLFKRIRVVDKGRGLEQEFTERVARFQLADFQSFFSGHNLVITETFGDYHFGSFEPLRSPRLILLAERKTA
jgi:SAM-dependent methyltransferase